MAGRTVVSFRIVIVVLFSVLTISLNCNVVLPINAIWHLNIFPDLFTACRRKSRSALACLWLKSKRHIWSPINRALHPFPKNTLWRLHVCWQPSRKSIVFSCEQKFQKTAENSCRSLTAPYYRLWQHDLLLDKALGVSFRRSLLRETINLHFTILGSLRTCFSVLVGKSTVTERLLRQNSTRLWANSGK